MTNEEIIAAGYNTLIAAGIKVWTNPGNPEDKRVYDPRKSGAFLTLGAYVMGESVIVDIDSGGNCSGGFKTQVRAALRSRN